MAKGSPSPRETAWRLLRTVWTDGAYANLAWSDLLKDSTLSESQRGFATDLAYGTLRYSGTLTRMIEAAAGRPEQSVDPELWWVLQLGAYQALLGGVPVHAAVDESVTLAHALGLHRGSGLVNAVMRKVCVRSFDDWCSFLVESGMTPSEERGLRFAHPAWIVDALAEALTECGHPEELDTLLASHNRPPSVTLAVLPGVGSTMPGDHPTELSPCGVRAPSGDLRRDSRVIDGVVRVQDEGSQLASLLVTRAFPLGQGETIVDACAGPGGKAALVSADAALAGARVIALEKHPHRADLVRHALKPFAHSSTAPEVITTDAVEWLGSQAGHIDRILLDAPCLGLGSLRRRIESRWTKSLDDLPGLVTLQRDLLIRAAEALKPGGMLVYVTCSPVVEETTEQVSWLLAQCPWLEALDTPSLLDSVVGHPVEGTRRGQAVQLWPHRHHTDAMFIQCLRRRG